MNKKKLHPSDPELGGRCPDYYRCRPSEPNVPRTSTRQGGRTDKTQTETLSGTETDVQRVPRGEGESKGMNFTSPT